MKIVSRFSDNIQILLGIKDEEDTQMPQNDLHKLYKWADTNDMKLNAKFNAKKAMDKMGWVLTVERVSVTGVLSHADTLKIYFIPLLECCC